MTTAISISDEVYETAEQVARQLGISRNELYETALQHYFQTRSGQAGQNLQERFDAVYDREDSALAPLLAEVQARSVGKESW